MNHLALDKNWIVIYIPKIAGRPMHIYHVKCAVSRGTSSNIKWVKCPRCKHKLHIWLLSKAKCFIKTHQMANLDIQI
jgi:hypothetical protein